MAAPCVKVYYGNLTMLPDAARVLACLHEKEVKFELQEMNKGCNLPTEFFKLQASTRVPGPAFDDGTRVFFESRPICRYISEKYPSQGNQYLLGRDLLERSSIEQWVKSEEYSFDPPSWTLVFHLAFAPCLHMEPDLVHIQESERKLNEVLDVYEQRLGESKYLAGNEFSLADLTHLPNSHYLANSKDWSYLFTSRKHVNKWWKRISERRSWKEAVRILDKAHPKQREDYNHEEDPTITVSFYQQKSPDTLTLQQNVDHDTVTLDASPTSSTQHPLPPPDLLEKIQPSESPKPPLPPADEKPDAIPRNLLKSISPSTTNLDGLFPGGKRRAPQPSQESLLSPMEGESSSSSTESKDLQPSKPSPSSTTQPNQTISEATKEKEMPFPTTSHLHLAKSDPDDSPSMTLEVEPLFPSRQEAPLSFESSTKEAHIPQSEPRSLPSSTKPETESSFNLTPPPIPIIPNMVEMSKPTAPLELSFPPTFDVNIPSEDLQGESELLEIPPKLQTFDSASTEFTNIPSAPSQPEKSSSPSAESEDLEPNEQPPLYPTAGPSLTETASPIAPVPQEPYAPPTSKDYYPSPVDSKREPQPEETALMPQAFDSTSATSKMETPFPPLSSSAKETDFSSPSSQLEAEQPPQESPSLVSSKKPETSLPSAEIKGTQPSNPFSSSTAIPPEPSLLVTMSTEISNKSEATKKEEHSSSFQPNVSEPSLLVTMSTEISKNNEATKKEEHSPSFQPNVSEPSSTSVKPSSEESSQSSNSDDGATNPTSQFAFTNNSQNLSSSSSLSVSFPPSNLPNDAATTPDSKTPPSKPSSKPILPPEPHSPSK